ncbi:MAG: hypothetical protein K8T89_00520 [Planctomycetes bacterium]|nr:hypothetical protein [Planctomycetota bacterium]
MRTRLAARKGDPSDADFAIYQQLARQWQEPEDDERFFVREIDTNGLRESIREEARSILRREDLL